jgi:hypothetical protein
MSVSLTYKDLPIIFRDWSDIYIPCFSGVIDDSNFNLLISLASGEQQIKLTSIPSFHPRPIATSGSISTVSSPPTPPVRDEEEVRPDHPRYPAVALEEDGVRGSRCRTIDCGR